MKAYKKMWGEWQWCVNTKAHHSQKLKRQLGICSKRRRRNSDRQTLREALRDESENY